MTIDTITTNASGVVLSTGSGYGNPVTVAPTVTLSAGGGYGIYVQAEWAIQNQGTIDGILFQGSNGFSDGTVINEGSIGASYFGIGIGEYGGASITLDNFGTISPSGDAVFLNDGGSVTNESGGVISGSTGMYIVGTSAGIINHGSIDGTAGAGVDLRATTNSIDNTGYIGGADIGVAEAGTSATLDNSGTIVGSGSEGVKLTAGQSLIHNTGYIGGATGVREGGANATLENAGTIHATGGMAAYLYATGSNRLIVDAGAAFTGFVKAKASTGGNTIELTSAASAGTISNLGYQYIGFGTITIDAGANWTVAGSITGFGGVTVEGFNNHDRLDLTDLNFSAGDTVSFDDGTNLLTIKNGGGSTLATIHLDDSADGHAFQLLDDGHGHTFVEETDYTPCYLKGTRIRMPRGDRAVETLRIGDMIATMGGEALPLKWIGRRSYRDWLAVGNEDAQPILFKAGSIADGIPARDLYVSPEHAMFVDGMLIPARYLVNGASIVKTRDLEEIDYFHLEFDRHAVIFAEGATAESFVDDDSRMLFHNAAEYRRLYPDESRRREVEFCAPRVEAGHALETVQRALAARALGLRSGRQGEALRLGYLDRATRSMVEGWALDHRAAAGDGPVRLAIVVNGAVVGQTLADRARADLKSSGLGDCGFSFVLPRQLSPELNHRIEVRRESDWTLLTGASVTLKPAETARAA